MLPVDNVKTHCQAGSRQSIKQIVKQIYRKGGISNFYSGSSVIASGCAPAHAISFAIYEASKNILECNA
jgi:solute carrier family 25 iron transporter 28/37